MKTTRGVRSCLKAPLWVLHAACAKILARWFTEKTEVSNEQAESVEHVKVRSTKSKTGKPRLLNTEPLPGKRGWTREESSLRPGGGGRVGGGLNN